MVPRSQSRNWRWDESEADLHFPAVEVWYLPFLIEEPRKNSFRIPLTKVCRDGPPIKKPTFLMSA